MKNIELLQEYSKEKSIIAKKLFFSGVEEKDVYNITAPFIINGIEYMVGRVEQRKNEINSKTMFFIKDKKDNWKIDPDSPVFDLQDPFISMIKGEIVLGGVEVKQNPTGPIEYRTIFFRGKSINGLTKFAQGPIGMKDIRIISLDNNKIGLFTRPQGSIGGKGRIGFMIISTLNELSNLKDENYYLAPLIPLQLSKEEWVGANALCNLANDLIGVIGHIANFSDNFEKNYYPIAFTFNYATGEISQVKIIASRDDLPHGESKRAELKNILFPGGIIRNNDGTAKLYVGAGDAESYELLIRDPFTES